MFGKNELSICLNIYVNQAFLGAIMIGKSVFDMAQNDANKAHKDIVVEFLRLVASGEPEDGLIFFDPDCKTHNPYTAGGIKELIDAIIAVQKQSAEGIMKGSQADFKLIIRQVIADGDMVVVHTQVAGSKPSDGGLRQAHIFRFIDNKIVEYWDITQNIPENAPNAEGAFS